MGYWAGGLRIVFGLDVGGVGLLLNSASIALLLSLRYIPLIFPLPRLYNYFKRQILVLKGKRVAISVESIANTCKSRAVYCSDNKRTVSLEIFHSLRLSILVGRASFYCLL